MAQGIDAKGGNSGSSSNNNNEKYQKLNPRELIAKMAEYNDSVFKV